MSKTKYIYLIALFGILSNISYSQTDSMGIDKANSYKLYTGFGGGYGSKGGTFGMSVIFVSYKNLGGSISYKTNILQTEDVPYDYKKNSDFHFAPRDYLSLISLTLIKDFSASQKSGRFGIEAGPSLVKYNVAQFKINPSYVPNSGNVEKYKKTRVVNETIGLALRAKADVIVSSSVGLEFAVFGNINSVQPVIGFEFYLISGKVSISRMSKDMKQSLK